MKFLLYTMSHVQHLYVSYFSGGIFVLLLDLKTRRNYDS